MSPILSIAALTKKYASGLVALDEADLTIDKGEIFALLGPNGAGKTTLIGVVCGIVSKTSGRVLVAGHDIAREYRAARSKVGLVPQEIALDIFSTVWRTVRFSRGLFGRRADDHYLEQLLRDLSLWEKRDSRVVELSGGMKRRVMIAKALSHEPEVLFLDEPTAGLDPISANQFDELIKQLQKALGLTVFLVTHDIDTLRAVTDRIAVLVNKKLVIGTISELRKNDDPWIKDYFSGVRGRAALSSMDLASEEAH